MEENFRVRIDKIFGSLSSSSSSSSSPSSLWRLADQEIDTNERSGEKKVFGSQPGLFDSTSAPDIRSQVDVDELRSILSQKPSDYNDEEWEIKSSIGMDSTLDMEEEEDANDKVAVGDEVFVYAKDLNEYETEADEWEELPASFKEVDKDPRANHIAAKLRLKEDADVLKVSLDELFMSTSANEKALLVSQEVHVSSSDENGLKPILKRKENQADSKLKKRVRFSSDIRDDNWTGGDKDSVMETSSPDEHRIEPGDATGIPDYLRNPSKYTRYTFDSGDVNEESNQKAYMDFLNMIRGRDEPQVDTLVELPKSVAFVPKKKPMVESKVESMDTGCEGRKGAIAVDSIEEDSTVSAMEEDEPQTALNFIRKPSRQYRARAKEDQEEC